MVAGSATSGAEGLMYMGELISLQMARAWLAAALSGDKGQAKLARALATKIASYSGGKIAPYPAWLRELREMLSRGSGQGVEKAPTVARRKPIPRSRKK